jgi:hypothetical protein
MENKPDGLDMYYPYSQEGDWIFLQNGQEIVFAKKKRVARLDDFTYALKYVEDTCKALVYDVKDIDIIFLKK